LNIDKLENFRNKFKKEKFINKSLHIYLKNGIIWLGGRWKMNSNLIGKEGEIAPEVVRFLSLLYKNTVFFGPIPLSEAITLATEEMNLSRFEALALYYRAKRESLIQVECFRDQNSSFTTYISIRGKGIRALMEVAHK